MKLAVVSEIDSSGTWCDTEEQVAWPEWSPSDEVTNSPYGTSDDWPRVQAIGSGSDQRQATVNQDANGNPLGIAIVLSAAELRLLGVNLDGIRALNYWVEDGQLRFAEARSARVGTEPRKDV